MTETAPHHRDDWPWTYWPPLIGAAAPIAAVGLVLWRPLLLVALLLAGIGAFGWLRTVARDRDDGETAGQEQAITSHVVFAAALVIITALFYAASLRALVAHDLLRAARWPEGISLMGPGPVVATLAALAAALTGALAWRRTDRGPLLGTVAGGFILVHVAALVWHGFRLAAQGLTPSQGPAGSLYFWILFLHIGFATAGGIAVAFTARLQQPDRGPFAGATLFLAWIAVAWLLLLAVVHLHLFSVEGRRLIGMA